MKELLNKLKKSNYWHGESVRTGYVRDVYLTKITKYIGNNLIKVIIGQRRVGKSYVLRQIIHGLIEGGVNPKNIFYLNKEIVDFDSVRDFKDLNTLIELYKKELQVMGKVYYFLDEVQEIHGWEKIVNSLSQDHKTDAEVFISGSNSHLLSGELSTYLSGRYVDFEVLPFSFKEYCGFYSLKPGRDVLIKYLQTGGLPELFHLTDEEVVQHYVQSLKDTIIVKDIIKRRNVKNVPLLNTVFDYLCDNIGNTFSVNSIVKYLYSHNQKTNYDTISDYVTYLGEAFLVYRVDRFDIKGKTILGGEKKYYINDLSFRNYLFSSFDYGIGKHLENMMYLHYRKNGWNVYVGKGRDMEIDFVIERNGEKKYIQVAHSLSSKRVFDREFGNLEKIRDAYPKEVISMDDGIQEGTNKKGIKHIHAWNALMF